jgi:hypothetical protein
MGQLGLVSTTSLNANNPQFHLGCVGLTEPPEGEWYCENCTKFTV